MSFSLPPPQHHNLFFLLLKDDHSQQFNEIMPCIYGRFMEKEARQWRQIYKVLDFVFVSVVSLEF